MTLPRRLRDESEIPIIMLTGWRDEADPVMGLELGADDYLTNPWSPRELLARIRTVLRRRRAEVRQGRPEGVRAYRFDGWELKLKRAGSHARRPPCSPDQGRVQSARRAWYHAAVCQNDLDRIFGPNGAQRPPHHDLPSLIDPVH